MLLNRKVIYLRFLFNFNKFSFFFRLKRGQCFFFAKEYFYLKSLNLYLFDLNCIYISSIGFKLKTNLTNLFLNNFQQLMKGLNQGFYLRFKIVGLGFKIKRVFLENKKRYLKINLGYSHHIFYKMPIDINIFVKKKSFIIQGLKLDILMSLTKKLQNIRIVNPYKEKGILLFNKKVVLKSGKQQQK